MASYQASQDAVAVVRSRDPIQRPHARASLRSVSRCRPRGVNKSGVHIQAPAIKARGRTLALSRPPWSALTAAQYSDSTAASSTPNKNHKNHVPLMSFH